MKDDIRVRPTETGTERETLIQLLDFLRATVAHKVTGLSDDQLRVRPVPASELTIGGLVKHLAAVERWWFSIDFAGAEVPWPWTDDDPHGGFPLHAADTVDSVLGDYELECERSRRAIDGEQLDAMARGEDMHFNLRYALAHMIEETSRHCGHLDLLRESIDGARGE